MKHTPRKPHPPMWRIALAGLGRATLLAFGLAVLGVPLLALGYCTLIVPEQQARSAAVEAARLAACEHHPTVQISLGQHLLTVPANGAARLGLIAGITPTYVFNETGLVGQPSEPHFFCIPPELDQPPLAATSIDFHSNRNPNATPARADLRVIHGLATQDNIGSMRFFAHRPHWDSIAGGKDLAQPDPSQPAGQMTTARAVDQREPPFKAYDRMIARTGTPDAQGFLYAADCSRAETAIFSACTLHIADTRTDLTYRADLVRLPDDVYGWSPVQPLPDAFVEVALMMRRVLGQMRTATLHP